MPFSDIMFIGVDGIDAKQGLACANSAEAEILRTFVQHAKMKVVVADHSKLGADSKYLRCSTEEIDKAITDSGASASSIAPFEKLGITVTCVWGQFGYGAVTRLSRPTIRSLEQPALGNLRRRPIGCRRSPCRRLLAWEALVERSEMFWIDYCIAFDLSIAVAAAILVFRLALEAALWLFEFGCVTEN